MNIYEMLEKHFYDLVFGGLLVLFLISFVMGYFIGNELKLLKIDSLYWLFSAASQSLAALVAFLITGYALVLTILDKSKDDTLIELIDNFKSKCYFVLTLLIVICTSSITLDLISLSSIGDKNPPYLLFGIAWILNIFTIFLAAFFAMTVANPRRLDIIAKKRLKTDFPSKKPTIGKYEFLREVAKLDDMLMLIIDKKRLMPTKVSTPLEALHLITERGILSQDIIESIILIRSYRNLVIHGGVDYVEEDMYDLVKRILRSLDAAFDLRYKDLD